MTTNLPHIGSREFVGLPDYKLRDVLAKIDTGADFSSIWASDIIEQDGKLSFSLFGRGSRFYTGERIIVDTYGVTEVRNSFGDSELRYTVPLRLKLGGKVIRADMRLADRSRNRYPVLVGKKTLLNKFLVNVKVNNRMRAHQAQVLVLNVIDSISVRAFTEAVTAVGAGVKTAFRTYDELMVVMDEKKGLRLYSATTQKLLPRYDLIYFKTHQKRQEMAAVVAEYACATNTNFIDSEVAQFKSHTKLSQYARLARFGLAIPKTVSMHYSQLANNYDFIVKHVKLPFVFKDAAADKGEANYLIQTKKDFDRAVGEATQRQAYFVAQSFIQNSGDLRCLVLDKRIDMVIGRMRPNDSTHLNNTSTGGNATLLPPKELDSEAGAMAVKSAIILGRQVAGVDLMRSQKNGKWYILEVNNSPQIASGAYRQEKIEVFAKFLRRQAEK